MTEDPAPQPWWKAFLGLGTGLTLVGFGLSLMAAGIVSLVAFRAAFVPRQNISLESQLTTTLQALQQNSRAAANLLQRLQEDVANRMGTVHEIEARLEDLRQQRALLELTPDQKAALEALTRRPPSARDIFIAKEFWLGRVLPSTLLFVLGVLFTLWRSRKAPKVLLPPEIQQGLARVEQSIAQLVSERKLTPQDAERIGFRRAASMLYYRGGGTVESLFPIPPPNVGSTEKDRPQQ